jgi:hypothetical protein
MQGIGLGIGLAKEGTKAGIPFVAQNLKQELITTTNGKIPAIEA